MVYLQSRAVDDALDLLDVLITSKLLARAERESAKEKLRTLPKLGKASAKLAAAMGVLLEVTGAHDDLAEQATVEGGIAEPVSLSQVWAEIEAVVPRTELTDALTAVVELAGPPDSDVDEAWRTELVKRYATVRPFLPLLCEVIRFGAAPDGDRVLAALRDLPRLLGGGRNKVARGEIDETLLIGSWRRLVLGAPDLEAGCVDWRAWTFCVLEQFHRCLRRRDIYAVNSSKWGDPRVKLLAGQAWTTAKPTVLASLGLPPDPDEHLDARAVLLDATYREVADRVPANTAVRFDDTGYRRDIKAQANLQEGRHALARRIFHGQRGELRQRYYEGMEDQLGALGLVLNAIVLFTTRYLDAAITALRDEGYEVRDEDAARLSPFVRGHTNMLGRYSFLLPELAGSLRPLRDPDSHDENEE